jgi:hypothetical protein
MVDVRSCHDDLIAGRMGLKQMGGESLTLLVAVHTGLALDCNTVERGDEEIGDHAAVAGIGLESDPCLYERPRNGFTEVNTEGFISS